MAGAPGGLPWHVSSTFPAANACEGAPSLDLGHDCEPRVVAPSAHLVHVAAPRSQGPLAFDSASDCCTERTSGAPGVSARYFHSALAMKTALVCCIKGGITEILASVHGGSSSHLSKKETIYRTSHSTCGPQRVPLPLRSRGLLSKTFSGQHVTPTWPQAAHGMPTEAKPCL